MGGSVIIRWLGSVVLLSFLCQGTSTAESASATPVEPEFRRPVSDTFVLVHTMGLASWCWYRVEALLQDQGFNTISLDMTAHGKDKTDANSIRTVSHYAKPLIDFLATRDKKVILVAHGLGGVPVSYAMETYPEKIATSIFLTGVMPSSNEVPSDLIQEHLQSLSSLLMLQYQDPSIDQPTSVMLNITSAQSLLMNRSPIQDFVLATHLVEATPWIVFRNAMLLTKANYGSISRHYIRTGMDRIIPWDLQAKIIANNPPKRGYTLKNGDHCSFFSETPWLVKLLKAIAYDADQ